MTALSEGCERSVFRLEALNAPRGTGSALHVDLLLTPYLRYELTAYGENVEAGEEILVADRPKRRRSSPR